MADMDETLNEIAEATFAGQFDRVRQALDTLSARELRMIEWPAQELVREIAKAQVRKGE